MAIQVSVPPAYAKGPLYHVAVLETPGNGYDTVVISGSKNAAEAVATLKEGERSAWITETFTNSQGNSAKGASIFTWSA